MLLMEHYYQELDGENWFDFQDIYRDAVINAKDNSRFVEVGAYKGKSSVYMAVEIINSGKKINFDCIDNWSLADTREEFIKNIAKVRGYINVIDMISWDAAELYDSNSIDFCFIDGAHDYESVKKDIIAFLPKMKKGGLITGHDYVEIMDKDNQVYKAVNEVLGQINISLIRNVWIYEKP